MTVEITTLANGFRIVTEAMPGLQSASVGVWVDAGTRNESAAQNGIAHFLEHMAFKGTSRRSALQIAEEIEDVGGYLNAYTSRERTAYYARVLSADVALAIDLIADILRDPQLHLEEIETERGVILQEIGQSRDTPDDIIFDWLQETAFPDQPLGRAILGPPELVRAFGRDDLSTFIGQQYKPGRMILSAAGDVDHGAIVRLAEGLFGDMTDDGVPPIQRAAYRGGNRNEVRALEQAHFALALEAPGYRSDDFHAIQIASMVLGGGMSSRLFQEVREKRGLCYSIFAQSAAWDETGVMMIYAGTGEAEIRQLVDLTTDELRRVLVDLDNAEVARARTQARAGLVMGLESPGARAERLATMLSIWGYVPSVAEAVAKIDAVDADAIQSVIARVIASPPTLALYGPVATAPDADSVAARLVA